MRGSPARHRRGLRGKVVQISNLLSLSVSFRKFAHVTKERISREGAKAQNGTNRDTGGSSGRPPAPDWSGLADSLDTVLSRWMGAEVDEEALGTPGKRKIFAP